MGYYDSLKIELERLKDFLKSHQFANEIEEEVINIGRDFFGLNGNIYDDTINALKSVLASFDYEGLDDDQKNDPIFLKMRILKGIADGFYVESYDDITGSIIYKTDEYKNDIRYVASSGMSDIDERIQELKDKLMDSENDITDCFKLRFEIVETYLDYLYFLKSVGRNDEWEDIVKKFKEQADDFISFSLKLKLEGMSFEESTKINNQLEQVKRCLKIIDDSSKKDEFIKSLLNVELYNDDNKDYKVSPIRMSAIKKDYDALKGIVGYHVSGGTADVVNDLIVEKEINGIKKKVVNRSVVTDVRPLLSLAIERDIIDLKSDVIVKQNGEDKVITMSEFIVQAVGRNAIREVATEKNEIVSTDDDLDRYIDSVNTLNSSDREELFREFIFKAIELNDIDMRILNAGFKKSDVASDDIFKIEQIIADAVNSGDLDEANIILEALNLDVLNMDAVNFGLLIKNGAISRDDIDVNSVFMDTIGMSLNKSYTGLSKSISKKTYKKDKRKTSRKSFFGRLKNFFVQTIDDDVTLDADALDSGKGKK